MKDTQDTGEEVCYKEQAHEMFEERVTWIQVDGVEGRRKEISFLA